jgi:hypothetical protein
MKRHGGSAQDFNRFHTSQKKIMISNDYTLYSQFESKHGGMNCAPAGLNYLNSQQ